MSYNPQNPNGQATGANSSPIVIASDQSAVPVTLATAPLPANAAQDGTDSTGVTQLTGGVGIRGWLSGIFSKLATLISAGIGRTWTLGSGGDSVSVPNIDVALSTRLKPADTLAAVTSITNPVAITNANLDVAISTRTKPSDQQHAIIDSGSLTANAGTNLNTSALALESGHLANIDTHTPALGQANKAGSVPVTLASDQGTLPVSLTQTDNTSLYNSTLSAAGAITGIDTTGYSSLSIQIGNIWAGSLWIEGCNDNSSWGNLLVIDANELSMLDLITSNGNYVLKTSTKYIRINVLNYEFGTIGAIILGRTVAGISGADLLSFAMDKNSNLPLYVQETGTKKDATNALIPSDNPTPIYGSANLVNGVLSVIDTTGYNSIVVQMFGTWAGTVSFKTGNDGVLTNAQLLVGFLSSGANTPISSNTANGVYIFPCVGKYIYIQITAYTSGVFQSLSFLRSQPATASFSISPNSNLTLLNGVVPVTAGVGGTLAVGGNIAVGVAPTANPLLVGGVDGGNLVRKLLTDTSGRIVESVIDQAGTFRQLTALAPGQTTQNVAALPVQDLTIIEGQSHVELLAQILLELRIATQQLKELPLRLNIGQPDLDEPSAYRQEQSLFAV